MSHATPRLSVVVPVTSVAANRPDSTFEQTLVSVLQHRRGGTEVIVAHDGCYADPFELGDEVRFVVADSNRLIDSIAAGCDAAWGRYVAVLTDGHLATEGWCAAALSAFSDPAVAAVAPVLQTSDGEIIAAGWQDRDGRLMDPVVPTEGTRPLTAPRIDGVYLESSIWRREVLRSLVRACGPTDVTLATYAYSHLCRGKRWQSRSSSGCTILNNQATPTIDGGGAGRARLLRRLHQHFAGSSSAATWAAAARSLLGDPAEAMGTASAAIFGGDVGGWFQPDQVYAVERYEAARRAA